MNTGMKFLTLLQFSVLGASAVFIYNKDYKAELSQKIAGQLSHLKATAKMVVTNENHKQSESQEISDVKATAIATEGMSFNSGIEYKDHEHVKAVSLVQNDALLYEKINFQSFKEKDWNLDSYSLVEMDESLEVSTSSDEDEYLELAEVQVSELSTEEVSEHYGFVTEEKVVVASWAASFKAIDLADVTAEKKEEIYEETVSEDLLTQNRELQESIANELIDEVSNTSSSIDVVADPDYSPKKLEFTKFDGKKDELNTHEATSERDLVKASSDKIEKLDLNKILEESNLEFEELDKDVVSAESEENEYSSDEADVSQSVSEVIARELSSRAKPETKAPAKKKNALLAQAVSTQQSATDNRRMPETFTRKESKNPSVESLIKNRITAFGIDLEKSSSAEINGFDVSYSYEYNSNQSDENSGAIDFSLKTDSKSNVLKVNVRGDNSYIASNADLALEDGVQFSVPLLNREGLFKFFERKGFNGIGSIVLVELGDVTSSVNLSSPFEGKVFLDENFKEVEAQEAAQFVMFVGVKSGNSLLSFQTVDNEIVDKIINTTEDELYFETNEYLAAKRESIQLFEKKLMSNQKVPLELFNDKINYFNTNIQFEKKSQNTYSYLRPRLALGMRKYFEINRDQGLLVVGYSDNHQIEVPHESLIAEYQRIMGSDSEQSCFIQINMKENKEVKAVNYNGHTTHGDASNMNIDMLAVDSDGQHGEEIADKTKTIILGSNQQGTISLRIDYQDSTSQIFNTFCSPGTYLIEQL